MSGRPPSQPPDLPGYRYEGPLGSGGYADVFLYQQLRPRRRVAIKVLLADVEDRTVHDQFEAEADVMAALSSHPSIVTIHQADVSSVGRPFIVMEYCSRPNYGVRFRRERIPVPEALRVGIQIAGAVETAHRAGILHRDIKPANILVTDYDRAALTDFGISIAASRGEDIEDSTGMSIPWSAPESFADPPRADVRSDVFSLAATVYSMLAGRTPFEDQRARNTASELIRRIREQPLEPIPRPDIPPSLARALSAGMAKDPAARPQSALAFGRALQQIESELGLNVTPMDIFEERGVAASPHANADAAPHTRIRAVTTPRSPRGMPEEAAAGAPAAPPRPGSSAPGRPALPRSSQATPNRAPREPGPPGEAPGAQSTPARDPYAAIAPANGPLEAGGARAPRPGEAPVEESTVIRPAGAVPGGDAQGDGRPAPAAFASSPASPASRGSGYGSGGGGASIPSAASSGGPGGRPGGSSAAPGTSGSGTEDEDARRRRVPPWLVLALVGVLLLALGVGSVITVRRVFAEETTPPPTVTPSTVVISDKPLGKPGSVSITPLDMPGAPVGKAQITWTAPEGFTKDDYYEVRWDVEGPDYAVYRTVKNVKGRESTVRDMPPPAAGPQACVLVTAVREDGRAGEPERACTG